MIKHKPTIILFDMDGTTVRHINPRLLQVLEWLDDVIHKLTVIISKIFRKKIDRPPIVEFRKGKRSKLLVHRALHKMRRKEVDQIVEPCPGIYNLLEYLKANNIRMGIISNGLGKGYGHDILKTFKLERYYEVTIFREDIPRAKPHPDPILKAAEKMDPQPNEEDIIWYFGDRRKDILSALAAEKHLPCKIVPFAYNLHAAVAILNNGLSPDQITMGWPDVENKLRALLPNEPTRKLGSKEPLDEAKI